MTSPKNAFLADSFRKLIVLPLTLAGIALCGLMVIMAFLYFTVADSTKATDAIRLATGISTGLFRVESAERGFLLTGDTAFLGPFDDDVARLHRQLQNLAAMVSDDPEQLRLAQSVDDTFVHWHLRISQIIALRNSGQDIVPIVRHGVGRSLMSQISGNLDTIAARQRAVRTASYDRVGLTITILSAAVVLSFAVLAGVFGVYGYRELARVAAIKADAEAAHVASTALLTGQTRAAEAQSRVARMFVDSPDMADVGPALLALICQWSGALVGALYVSADKAAFSRVATYGTVRQSTARDAFTVGQGLPGEAARSLQAQWLTDVPHDYMPLASQLGDMPPSTLIALPLLGTGGASGVLELGFFAQPEPAAVALLAQLQATIGHAFEVSLLREAARSAETA